MISLRMMNFRRLTFLCFLFSLSLADAADRSSRPLIAGYERFFASSNPSTLGGQLLLSELSCTACHRFDAESDPHLAPKGGPVLDGIGFRTDANWLRRYMDDPQAVKPGATMPRMFSGLRDDQRRRQIEALVHFLSSQQERLWARIPPSEDNDPRASSYQRGYELYHRVGCVACHDPDPSHDFHKTTKVDPQEDDGRVYELPTVTDRVASQPHPDIPRKYTHETLTNFLLDPLKARPAGRMPEMKLSILEAADIAHYLLKSKALKKRQPLELQPELVAEGRRLFRSKGCALCHSLNKMQCTIAAPALDELRATSEHGCLSDHNEPIPDYPLDEGQRQAILAAISYVRAVPLSPAERVELTMMRMNCFACHTRKNAAGQLLGGVGLRRWDYFETEGGVDLGDEGRIPPPLTGVGRKLTRSWLKKVLEGNGDVRPQMLARMPKFGLANVGHLPAAFVAADGGMKLAEASVFPDGGDSQAGRQFMNLGCIQCHALNGKTMTGVVGIDLKDLRQRIQPAWFRAFVYNPGVIKPRTQMPTFFPQGQSTVKNILGGNTDRQIAALWAYLRNTKDGSLPEKLANQGNERFELIPTDQPILLRTFMRQAGTHAIAVGFPKGVHFSFDAELVRPAIAWRGRFLDAHGTWLDRFAPPAEPLSGDRAVFPPGNPLACLKKMDGPWPSEAGENAGYRMRGFRLDAGGVPTFLYAFQGVEVEDRMEPTEDGRGLIRELMLVGDGKDLCLRARVEKQDNSASGSKFEIFPSVKTVSESVEMIRVGNEFRIPLRFDAKGRCRIGLEYRW